MRILQVHNRYRHQGGEDTVVRTERQLLESKGHRVVVYEVENPLGSVQSLRSLARAPWNSGIARRIADFAVERNVDVAHVHNTWFSISPAVFRHLSAAGIPTVATVHNYRPACVNALFYREGRPCEDCLGRLPWRGVVRACYRGSHAQSAAVALTIGAARWFDIWNRDVDVTMALTPFAGAKLVSAGIHADRVVVKPNLAADPGERTSAPSESDEVLFVGRATEEKGLMDLVRAWEPHWPLKLVVVGDGPLLADVKKAAPEGIAFVGAQDPAAVRRHMLSARSLVVPSRWYEGLPMVVLEGMAAGLGVVVPGHGGLPGVVEDAGLMFSPGDVSALRRTLQCLESSSLVDALGERARGLYLERFHPDVVMDQLIAAYSRAIEHRGAKGAW